MDRLTPLADAFLEVEDVDPAVSLAIGSLAVLGGPAPRYDEFLALVDARLPLVPRYRQRLRRVPFDLAAPAWVADEAFDLRNHVMRAAVPSPGGPDEVAGVVAALMSARMDRSRPLWESWLIEGLADGNWAVLSRVHHCLADGVSGTDLYRLFLDLAPNTSPLVPAPAPCGREQTPTAFAALGLGGLAGYPARVATAVGRLSRTPVRSANAVAHAARGLLDLSGAARPVHPSSLLGPIGADRRFTWVEVHMSEVADVRRRCGASVNDVALAAIAGGFRRLLLGRRESPDARTVRSLVPVSTRAKGDESVTDNQVSLLPPYLPVDVADPV
ncbi:MAG: wax ester/triacylglycerol synthase family O-acyltransferase, partial [Nocardioides sp.]|nr:wax ester/triacylglycerol synthase family O-acyltransferase [Nocardioides sp.]